MTLKFEGRDTPTPPRLERKKARMQKCMEKKVLYVSFTNLGVQDGYSDTSEPDVLKLSVHSGIRSINLWITSPASNPLSPPGYQGCIFPFLLSFPFIFLCPSSHLQPPLPIKWHNGVEWIHVIVPLCLLPNPYSPHPHENIACLLQTRLNTKVKAEIK